MQNDACYIELQRQMSPVDEPGFSARGPLRVRRLGKSILQAAITVPILAIVTYFLLFFSAVAFALQRPNRFRRKR
jgi:hypothetical protein